MSQDSQPDTSRQSSKELREARPNSPLFRARSGDLVEVEDDPDRKVKQVVLLVNLVLVVCKWIALVLCQKYSIKQSLFDSLGDVLGNVAVILFRDEIGVLILAAVMGLASVGVIVPSASSLLQLAGFLNHERDPLSIDTDRLTSVILILVAIITKGLVFACCRFLGGTSGCSIAVQAIKEDAVNDVMMNSGALLCGFPELWVALFAGLLPKSLEHYLMLGMDPAWAFFMSLPILHGWCKTAAEQISTLRAEAQEKQSKKD